MRPHTFLLVAVLAAGSALAADDPMKAAPPAYRQALIEAMKAFTERNLTSAKEIVEKADAGYKATPLSLNLLGAISIENKQFDEGRAFCERALKLDPKFFPSRFNLAEIPFVQGKYAEARTVLESLYKEDPKNELLRFRIYLTYLLEKNDREAKARLDDIPLINDTPISFYANAAWEFAHGNGDKGREWIASALRSFPPVRQINFVEVFYDLGWLERVPAPAPQAR